jgi:hypothetical protein
MVENRASRICLHHAPSPSSSQHHAPPHTSSTTAPMSWCHFACPVSACRAPHPFLHLVLLLLLHRLPTPTLTPTTPTSATAHQWQRDQPRQLLDLVDITYTGDGSSRSGAITFFLLLVASSSSAGVVAASWGRSGSSRPCTTIVVIRSYCHPSPCCDVAMAKFRWPLELQAHRPNLGNLGARLEGVGDTILSTL